MAGKSIAAKAAQRTKASMKLDALALKDKWFVLFIDDKSFTLYEDNEPTATTILKSLTPFGDADAVVEKETTTKGIWILENTKIVAPKPLFYIGRDAYFSPSAFCYKEGETSEYLQLPFHHAITFTSSLKVVRGTPVELKIILQ